MDIYRVLGFRPYSFTDEKTGKLVSGVTFWFGKEWKNGHGYECVRKSISRTILDNYEPSYGDDLYLYADLDGRIIRVDYAN